MDTLTGGERKLSGAGLSASCMLSCVCQKRPSTVSKETQYRLSASWSIQKRPSIVSKETYYSVKRDLVQCQKRLSTGSQLHGACYLVYVGMCESCNILFFALSSRQYHARRQRLRARRGQATCPFSCVPSQTTPVQILKSPLYMDFCIVNALGP